MGDTFEREYELEDGLGVLVFRQLEKGDVNCVVWDASIVLAKYLEVTSKTDPNWLKKKRILELGAGLGCVGLVASCYGGNVILTDQLKALPLLNHNIEFNRDTLNRLHCNIAAKSLDWNEKINEDPVEVLLIADCVYYPESIDPLIRAMLQLTTPSTQILLCQEDRSYSDIQKSTWELFKLNVGEHFTITDIPLSSQHHQYRSSDIMLLQLAKK